MPRDPLHGRWLAPADLLVFGGCSHAARRDHELAHARTAAAADGPADPPARGARPDVHGGTDRRLRDAVLADLRARGRVVRLLDPGDPRDPPDRGADADDGVRATLAAMRDGADAIAGARLACGSWRGTAALLLRREGASRLGAHHYEVQHFPPERTADLDALLQAALLSNWLAELQGRPPHGFALVGANPEGGGVRAQRFRLDDYAAYARRLQRRFERFLADLAAGRTDPAPEPVAACASCRWWRDCDAHWRATGHLSLVAGLGREHRLELQRHGVTTVAQLAAIDGELPFRPRHGSPESYLAAARQARLQLAARDLDAPPVEPLPDAAAALAALPDPGGPALFLAIEGGRGADPGGAADAPNNARAYAWGWAGPDGAFEHRWAGDAAAERRALDACLDRLAEVHHAGGSVFHYGASTVGALKRAASRHASREDDLDALLRAEVFVDLQGILRRTARVGVEAYTLEALQPLHGHCRETDARTVAAHRRALERSLASGAPAAPPAASRAALRVHLRDEVLSMGALAAWLERQRHLLEAQGAPLPRREREAAEPSEAHLERRAEVERVAAALRARLPEHPAAWSDEHRARALLAATLDFEHREDKVGWWEFFAHASATPDALERSKRGVAGLQRLGPVDDARGGTVRFRFPPQDLDARPGMNFVVVLGGEPVTVGRVAALDPAAHTLDLRMGGGHQDLQPASGFFQEYVPPSMAAESRLEFARDVLERGLDAPAPYRATRDLLLGRVGRTADGTFGAARLPDESTVEAATRLALALDGGVLPIQGPPGAGKTYTAARMIVELVRQGRKVAVTATANKVIANLLAGVVSAAREAGVEVRVGQKASKGVPEGVTPLKNNDQAASLALKGELDVIGGTTWLWTRPAFQNWADHLVIDEAGQMSLAAALSNSGCARNVVLLGDPQQLEQPIQAVHPDGGDVAALRHLIGEGSTLPPGRGLFLDETYRLAPALCAFTSEVFYERKLRAAAGNECIALRANGASDAAGFRFVPVAHEGRAGWCPEEAETVRGVIDELLAGSAFRSRAGEERPLTPRDVLVVAPFNRQVRELEARVPDGVRVGTVDRFQGQEAPVVVYSLGVSGVELAPRGLGFLFNGNRLNVASSRAQALTVLVANERLFDAACHTAEEMRLANAFARLLEFCDAPGGS